MKLSILLKTAAAAAIALAISAPIAQAFSGEYFVTCRLNPNADNFLALRTCGSTRCPIIKKLPPDTFLIVAGPHAENRWREVTVITGLQGDLYSGPTGWVYDKYICGIDF